MPNCIWGVDPGRGNRGPHRRRCPTGLPGALPRGLPHGQWLTAAHPVAAARRAVRPHPGCWYERVMTLDASPTDVVSWSDPGITQTLAWGSTYYLPAVFADPIATALDVPRVWFFGIFSAALLLSGLLGPLAGRRSTGMAAAMFWPRQTCCSPRAWWRWPSRPDGRPGAGLDHPGYRHGVRPVRGGLRHGGRPLRTRGAQRDHRHHPVRRLRQHGGLARQRDLHRRIRLARRLPGLGRAAPADRVAAEPPAGPRWRRTRRRRTRTRPHRGCRGR